MAADEAVAAMKAGGTHMCAPGSELKPIRTPNAATQLDLRGKDLGNDDAIKLADALKVRQSICDSSVCICRKRTFTPNHPNYPIVVGLPVQCFAVPKGLVCGCVLPF
jgi:hypothetical protein